MENHDKPARLETPFNFAHQQPRLPLVYRAHLMRRAVPGSGSPWETRLCLCLTRPGNFANVIVNECMETVFCQFEAGCISHFILFHSRPWFFVALSRSTLD
ncbi:hypothetical protein FOXYSP1_11114 [Fusarium oxysporum f. sp. phaseoli]